MHGPLCSGITPAAPRHAAPWMWGLSRSRGPAPMSGVSRGARGGVTVVAGRSGPVAGRRVCGRGARWRGWSATSRESRERDAGGRRPLLQALMKPIS